MTGQFFRKNYFLSSDRPHTDQSRLRYRTSIERVASKPEDYNWEVSLFGPILDHLPGATCPDKFFDQVTYPRFLDVGDDLLLSYRIGMYAGAGQLTNI